MKTAASGRTYRRWWLGALPATALLLGGGYWVGVRYFSLADGTGRPAAVVSPGASALRPAPAFSLPDAQTKSHALEELRGKVVLLHFWASWCPPCLNEMPDLLELAKSFATTDLRVLSVSLDEDWGAAHRILPENVLPTNWTSVIDLPRDTPDRFGSYQYPETYLLNRDLRIVHKFVGAQAWSGDEMTKLFRKLL